MGDRKTPAGKPSALTIPEVRESDSEQGSGRWVRDIVPPPGESPCEAVAGGGADHAWLENQGFARLLFWGDLSLQGRGKRYTQDPRVYRRRIVVIVDHESSLATRKCTMKFCFCKGKPPRGGWRNGLSG